MKRRIGLVIPVLALALGSPQMASAGGTLFAATDNEEFSSTFSQTGQDRLYRATTSGAVVTDFTILTTDYPINGVGEGNGFLFAGQPLTVGGFPGNTLRRIDFSGNLIASVLGGFPTACCNEEMALLGGSLYHAHFPDNIQELDPASGAVMQTFPQSDVVGMAVINNQIWISKWSGRQVGIWNPSNNTFIAVFSTNTPVFGPSNAGALAWDPVDNVLWLGLQGGNVIPVDLFGTPLGPIVQPFGSIPDTIDGLAFIPAPVDHYKCYEVEESSELFPSDPVVDLGDQFGLEYDVEVGEAKLFCNPVSKNGEEIINFDIHLTCYEIESDDDEERGLKIENQFDVQTLIIEESELLCLPSTKEVVDLPDDDDDDDDDD